MSLDYRIICIAFAEICFIFAIALFVGRMARFRFDGILQWTSAWALHGAFWTLLSFRGIMWDSVSIIVAPGLMAASLSLFYAGVREFQGRVYNRVVLLLPPAAAFGFFWYSSTYLDVLAYRAVFMSALSVLQITAIVWALFRDPSGSEKYSSWLTGLAFFVYDMIFVNRLIGALTGPHEFMSIMVGTMFQHMSVMAGFGVSIVASLGFVLMTWERAEGALRSSESKYRNLHEGMADAFVRVGMDGRILEFNEVFRKMLGHEREELLKLSYTDLTPQKWHAFEADIIEKQVLVRGYSDAYEKEYVRKDDTVLSVNLKTHLIRNTAGNPVEMWASVRDITESKVAEADLREALDRAQQYLDIAGVILLVLDNKGIVTLVNRRGHEILGYDEGKLVGMDWIATCIPDDTRDQLTLVYQSFLGGDEKAFEYHEHSVLTKQGERRLIAWHNTLLKDEAGNSIGSLSSGEEITERKEMEGVLRNSEAKFRAIAEDAPDVIVQSDRSLRYTYANRAVRNISGRDPEDFIGKTARELNVPRHLREAWDNTLNTVFRTGEVQTGEWKLTRSGKASTFQFRISPQTDPDGTVVSAVSVTREISELKDTEAQLRKSEAELRAKELDLLDMNSALKVLLAQRETDLRDLQERMVDNVNRLVSPYVDNLKHTRLNEQQATLIENIEARLNEIVSPFIQNLSVVFRQFTPKEIQVATLIRDGKTTKEIAEIMSVSVNATDIHRAHLRRKCNLVNKKANLRSYLLSLG